MIAVRLYRHSAGISQNLWNAFVDIDYGRAVPEKGYKGYKTFLKDVTGAEIVEGSLLKSFFPLI